MSNKKKIKKVIDNDFDKDKNYKVIIKKVERGEKNVIFLRYVTIPICLILVIYGVGVFNNRHNQLQKKPNINYSNCNGICTESDKSENYGNNEIHISEFIKITSGDLKLDVSIKSITLSELPSKFEFLYSVVVPSDFNKKDIYTLYASDETQNEDKKYDILKDYVIRYSSSDEKGNIRIAFSENGKPLRDYLLGDVEKISKINNVDVEISKYEDLFLATFKYNNLFFDIETRGITKEELIELLESIIK